MKKIVEIIPQLPSGGAERFVVDLSNELAKTHEVTLVIFFPLSKDWFYLNELSENVKVVSLNKRKLGFDFSMFIKLLWLLRVEKPKIVHLHLRSINYAFLSVLTLRRIHFFYTVHNDAFVDSGGRFSRMLRKFFFKKGLITPITISDVSLSSFQKAFSISAPLVYNGRSITPLTDLSRVDHEIEMLKKTPNTIVFLNVASIQPSKNQLMLANVINRLVSEGNDIILLLVGRVAYPEIEQSILELNCDCIHILGERNDPRTYMAKSDVFCLSSLYEGMPISLIEAFSVGLVPICTPVGGIVNMIRNGENGILSNDISLEEYYYSVKEYLSLNEVDRLRLKECALASYNDFTISRCAIEYRNVFKVDSL
ncbi:MAG: glycosyltransferase [Bacteroidales bacterium]|nr:MAG: glycosyltransferase [Bacteroidales bacterium]